MGFDAFFERATGHAPFPYQVKLATGAQLPDLLSVPTGAGKTGAAVLGWLWRRRGAAPEIRRATPRRLVFCLPMRTLVDQTVRVVEGWLEKLGLTDVGVHALLGGAVDQSWEGSPDRDAILVGTQDQLLSRALNRGYAMSRYRWPMHFGLLHNDALWVMDEVQLMGVGVSTAAQLQGFREALGTALPTHTLWMSATLAPGRLRTVDFRRDLTRLGLDEDDARHPVLARRLTAKKALAPATTSFAKKDAHADALAREIIAAHEEGSLTLVVVNRVSRAQALFKALRRLEAETALLHSRFRAADRERVQDLVLAGGWRGVLVATQAIEAGVDISARALFTEIAPWDSLVQRFGRCNRGGELDEGRAIVRWIDVPDEEALPYAPADLAISRQRLEQLSDVGPESLRAIPQDDGSPALPVLRHRDLMELFDTQPDLAGHDLDVSRFVRDADDRPEVQVLWRDWEGASPPSDFPEPRREELCVAPVYALEKLLKKAKAFRWNGLAGEWERVARPVPGNIVLFPTDAGGYDDTLGFTGDPKHRPAPLPAEGPPPDYDEAEPLSFFCNEYVLLSTHSSDVTEMMSELHRAIGGDQPWNTLRSAARAHDVGKAHEAFQQMLVSGLEEGDARRQGGPWAKSDGTRGRHVRRHFRHELASALALLELGRDDLEVYLVAAHHGKVRLSIRPRPTEQPPADGARFALGVWDGDVLPAVDLGDGERLPETRLSLDVMELGEHDGHPSWLARMLALLEEHGPFRLAYWETLVRVADWRGTRLRTLPVTSEVTDARRRAARVPA